MEDYLPIHELVNAVEENRISPYKAVTMSNDFTVDEMLKAIKENRLSPEKIGICLNAIQQLSINRIVGRLLQTGAISAEEARALLPTSKSPYESKATTNDTSNPRQSVGVPLPECTNQNHLAIVKYAEEHPEEPYREIAARFGKTSPQISKICRNYGVVRYVKTTPSEEQGALSSEVKPDELALFDPEPEDQAITNGIDTQ